MYFQKANEMTDEILGPNYAHPITSDIFHDIGVVHQNEYGDLPKSVPFLQDALTMNFLEAITSAFA